MSAFTLFTRRAALMSSVLLGGIILTACSETGQEGTSQVSTPQSVPVEVTPVDVTPVEPVNPFAIPDDMAAGAAFAPGVAAYKAKNYGLAENYFKRASSGNIYAADNYLGLIYGRKGDLNNPEMSAKHFERALTDMPRLTPLTKLARAYAAGEGVTQDVAMSLQYFARVVSVSSKPSAALTEAREALAAASADDLAMASSREARAITLAGRRAGGSLQDNVAIALGDLDLNVAPR